MKLLFLINYQMARNRILRLRFSDEVKIAFFLLLNVVFLTGIYIGSYRFLSYLNDVPLIGNLVVNKLTSMLFMTSFFMVAFSSLITSFNTLYFSKDLPWLLSMPIPASKTFASKAINTVFYSSWMVLVLILPFLLALTNVKNAGPVFYWGSVLLLVPFFFLASLCGITVNLAMVRVFPARRARDTMMVLAVIFVVGVYMLFRFLEPEKLARPEGMDAVAQYLSFLDAPAAPFLPSWWATAAVFSLLGKGYKSVIYYSSLLTGSAVFLFCALCFTADKIFLKGWAENQSVQKRKALTRHGYSVRPPAVALFIKDFKIFFRDANQWSQLLILGSLCAVYVFSIYKIPLNTPYLQNLVAFFNVGLISFVVSAVALRFVFPAVSLEGDSFWILKSAPFKPAGLLAVKTLFGAIPVVFIAVALSVASGLILKVEPAVLWASTAAVLMVSCGLNFMASGFGAIFPKFSLTSVAQIETSHGGLFYILAAVFYVGLNIALLAMPLQNYYRMKLGGQAIPWAGFALSFACIIILNAAAILVPFKLGSISLKRIEL